MLLLSSPTTSTGAVLHWYWIPMVDPYPLMTLGLLRLPGPHEWSFITVLHGARKHLIADRMRTNTMLISIRSMEWTVTSSPQRKLKPQ